MPPSRRLAFFKGILTFALSGCSYLIHDQGKDFERARPFKSLEVPAELRQIKPPEIRVGEVESDREVGFQRSQEVSTPPERERETATLHLPYPLEESWPLLLKAVAQLGGELEDVDKRQHRFKMRLIGQPARTPLEEITLIFRHDPLKGQAYLVEVGEEGGGTVIRFSELEGHSAQSPETRALLKRLQQEIETLIRR